VGYDLRARRVFRNPHLAVALQPHLLIQLGMPDEQLHNILRKGETWKPRLAAQEVDETLFFELLGEPVQRSACGREAPRGYAQSPRLGRLPWS